jgi:dTMP kinase
MFITLEGPDGSGKTTQIHRLYDRLVAAGYAPLLTREPGGTPIGDQIRDVLHSLANDDMVDTTEILLYSASRAQLVAQVIRPALEKGRLVLCDRYADSTMAYQGYGRRLDLDALQVITQFATGGLRPDLTILLDVDVQTGLGRKQAAEEWNRMDQQAIDFHQRTRAGYLALAAAEPDRWITVDASGPVPHVAELTWQTVVQRLERKA